MFRVRPSHVPAGRVVLRGGAVRQRVVAAHRGPVPLHLLRRGRAAARAFCYHDGDVLFSGNSLDTSTYFV